MKIATSQLIVEQKGSVVWLWLNRVEARNALSIEIVNGIIDYLASIASDRSIRSIVIRGKGGMFCAGGDIKGFQDDMQASEQRQFVAESNRRYGHLMQAVNEQPQTVIMLVEGAAIGGGMGLVSVADIAIATKDVKFRLSETSLGIPPAQIAPFVVERIGLTQARRLMLTGARFTGEFAQQIGLVHLLAKDSHELEFMCQSVLEDINQCAPQANATTKAILLATSKQPRDEILDFAADQFARCMLSDEGIEGVSAFIEKRSALWTNKKGVDSKEN